jgi:hypothetical protein
MRRDRKRREEKRREETLFWTKKKNETTTQNFVSKIAIDDVFFQSRLFSSVGVVVFFQTRQRQAEEEALRRVLRDFERRRRRIRSEIRIITPLFRRDEEY